MFKLRVFFGSILLLIIGIKLSAQLKENAIPYSVSENLASITSYIEMEPVDNQKCDSISFLQQNLKLKKFNFAISFETDLSPQNSGEWTETSKGKVWRLGIRSSGAFSLYFTFNTFYLIKGVKLFVYSPDYEQLLGAFTSKNNNINNTLSVAPIAGYKAIIEINVPKNIDGYGSIKISKVYHDYMNQFGEKTSLMIKSLHANDCDENINCENGKYWQTEKRSVCKIVIDGGLCTGTLIGNTSGSNEPYLISANHTIFDSAHAANAIFYFNYEKPSCNTDEINYYHTLSGASLVATTEYKLDFSLIRLNDVPPVSYFPYYAGWNVSGNAPQGGICIHHPLGYVKQIAIENHPLVTDRFSENYDPASTWKVRHWEIGTTEAGSSGAPLFDDRYRLVGTLMGGKSTCGYPIDDYFTKLSLSWDFYPSSENNLKYWLDPINTGEDIIDGYDPYGFNPGFCDTAWNFQNYQDLELSDLGLKWGWISGHNSAGITQFAEKFVSSSSIQIPGIFMHVAKAYNANPLSNIIIKVWEGEKIPENEIYRSIFFIRDLQPNIINYIGFDSLITVKGNFFLGYEVNYSHPMDTFAIFHTNNSKYQEVSSMYIYIDSWQNINSCSCIGIAPSLGIGIVECYGQVRRPLISNIHVYPNPCVDFLFLDIPTESKLYSVLCYDASGRKVPVFLEHSVETNRLDFDLPSGFYLLKIVTDNRLYSTKFVVIQ